MNHALGARSIARPVDLPSSVLRLPPVVSHISAADCNFCSRQYGDILGLKAQLFPFFVFFLILFNI